MRFVPILLILLLSTQAYGKTWTRKDGRKAEGELVAKSDSTVTIIFENKGKVTIPILELSLNDQQFIKSWKAKPPKRPIRVPNDAVFHDGHWYSRVLEEVTWKRAKDKANKLGGHLAWIKNKETQAIVSKLADGLQVWIGGSDEEVEGLWKWEDSTKFTYTNWFEGEPNNLHQIEHYLALTPKGEWNDCPSKTLGLVGFIVQWD